MKFKDIEDQETDVTQQPRQPPDGSAFAIAPIIETKIVEVPAPKPPSTDATVWTHEPQYDYSLNAKICRPVGVDRKDLKCSINFMKEFRLSEVYEKPSTPAKGEFKGWIHTLTASIFSTLSSELQWSIQTQHRHSALKCS